MSLAVKRTLIIVGTIIFALIGVEIVVNPLDLPTLWNEHVVYFTIMTIFCILMWFGWIEGDENDNNFLNFFGVFLLVELTALINVETFPYPSILFWVNLVIWIVLSVIFTDIEELDFSDKLISYSFSLFVATTAFITIGYHPIFSYSYVPIEEIKYINDLIDIRLIFGIAFILMVTIKAVVLAFREGKPDIETISSIDIETSFDNNLLKIFSPIIIIIKLIINLLVGVINFSYLIILFIIIYLYRIGLSIGQTILSVLSKSFFIFKLILILTTLLFVAQFARELTPNLIKYLVESSFFTYELFLPILLPIFYIIISLFVIVFILSIKFEYNQFSFDGENFEDNLQLRGMVLSTISVMLWLSGFSLFLLSQIRFLSFINFRMGSYNVFYSGIVFIGLFVFIVMQIVKKK